MQVEKEKTIPSKLKGVLNCSIWAVFKKSNDEIRFVLFKKIGDYCEKSDKERRNIDWIKVGGNEKDLEDDHEDYPKGNKDDV